MLLHRHFEEDGKKANKNMTTSVDVSPSRKFTEEGADMNVRVTPTSEQTYSREDIVENQQRRGRPRRV